MIIPEYLKDELEGKEYKPKGVARVIDLGVKNTWEIPGLLLDMLNRDRGKGLKGGLSPRLSHVRQQDAEIRAAGAQGIGGTPQTRLHNYFDGGDIKPIPTDAENRKEVVNKLPSGVTQEQFNAWSRENTRRELEANIDDPRYDAKRNEVNRIQEITSGDQKTGGDGFNTRWIGENSRWISGRTGEIIAPHKSEADAFYANTTIPAIPNNNKGLWSGEGLIPFHVDGDRMIESLGVTSPIKNKDLSGLFSGQNAEFGNFGDAIEGGQALQAAGWAQGLEIASKILSMIDGGEKQASPKSITRASMPDLAFALPDPEDFIMQAARA